MTFPMFNPAYMTPQQLTEYQTYLNQQMAQLQQTQQNSTRAYSNQGTIIDRVQGEAAANVYAVNAGQEAILLDMDNPYVYYKSRDFNNKLEEKRFRLVEDEKQEEQPVNLDGYVKEEEITAIVAEAVSKAVDKKFSEISFTPTPAKTRKAKTEEE